MSEAAFDLLQLVGLLVFIIAGMISVWALRYKRPGLKNSSVLLTYYTRFGKMIPLASKAGKDYIERTTFVMAGGTSTSLLTSENDIIDVVFLPFTTKTRLLAIPTSAKIKLNPSLGRSIMEKVDLEGNFYKHFTLFANKGDGARVRYVLDPKAMAFVIDVCNQYNWEIVNNELIMISDGRVDDEMVSRFIKEIRPAVEISSETVDPLVRQEYKPIGMRKLYCPICSTELIHGAAGYVCPKSHGRAITGKAFSDLKNDSENIEQHERMGGKLKCPNCRKPMEENYYRRQAIIDSCTNCPFRWLDNGEFEASPA